MIKNNVKIQKCTKKEIDKGYLKEERTGSWEHPKDATPEVSW